jgi:hypothetical protein
MSNQSKELQKVETQESLVKKTAIDTTSKTISTSIVEGGKYVIPSLVTSTIGSSILGFIAGLPVYLYIPLGALVFSLMALGFYLISYRPKYQLLLTELKSLEVTHLAEKENLISNNQIRIREVHDVFTKALAEKEAILLENQNLLSQKSHQKESIDEFVILERFFYCRHTRSVVPIVIFSLDIVNKSFFHVIIDSNIGGYIVFENLDLIMESKRFLSSTKIAPMRTANLTFEYRLSNTEFEYIEEIRKRDFDWYKEDKPFIYPFKIQNLNFTITGTEINSKQLKISDKMRVTNADKYYEAQSKFQ